MAKVKALQVVPLGRKPKDGEWCISPGGVVQKFMGDVDLNFVAVERREVEVEVPDPVPEWMLRAEPDQRPMGACPWCDARRLAYAAAFRAHVSERAKAAAEAWWVATEDDKTVEVGTLERIIREEFLK